MSWLAERWQGRAGFRKIVWLLAALLPLLTSTSAVAQVQFQFRLGASEIEVGESVAVELTAMASEGERPSSPELTLPSGFVGGSPQVGTRQSVSINGFSMVRTLGITATWRVRADRAGLFSIGPASVLLAGSRHQVAPVQLKVVPAGQLAASRKRRRRRGRLDPFSTRNPFDDLFGDMRRGASRASRLPPAPQSLILRSVPDKTAFLRSVVSPRRAVVGQQVTLSIYAYGAKGLFQEAAGSREASYPDFLAHRIVEDPSEQPVYEFDSGNQTWIVVKVREIALFPLKSGELEIGAAKFGFLGRRYSAQSSLGLQRKSRSHKITVTKPPLERRPAGFDGDVGRFKLSAKVEPREVAAGGSISVQIRVTGSGRLPTSLKMPEQNGVHWDEPTLRSKDRVTSGKLGGESVFQYVVRLTEPGDIDLGSVKLIHFNPRVDRYRVARARLGRVLVAQASREEPADPRTTGARLSDSVQLRSPMAKGSPQALAGSFSLSSLGWLLAAGPVASLLVMGGMTLLQALRRRNSTRNVSPRVQAEQALSAANKSLGEGQLETALLGLERALYLAVEVGTGVKARGVLRTQLLSTLIEAGASADRARQVVAVLGQFEAVRFSGEPANELSSEVSALCKALLARRRSSTGASSVALILFVALCVAPDRVSAIPFASSDKDTAAEEAVRQAMAKGAHSAAIDQLELWSDQGRRGRDLSFNRGVAYLARAESSARKDSDLGQAVAAFQEAWTLDPSDEQALRLAQTVRSSIAEERAKTQGGRIAARPRLVRAVVDLVAEGWWIGLAALGSLLVTVALWLGWLGRQRVSSAFTALVGALGLAFLLGGGAMIAVSEHLRVAFEPAVVIVAETPLLNESGQALVQDRGPSARGSTGNKIGMGSLVYVFEDKGALTHVEWGDRTGWVRGATLRRLVRPRGGR